MLIAHLYTYLFEHLFKSFTYLLIEWFDFFIDLYILYKVSYLIYVVKIFIPSLLLIAHFLNSVILMNQVLNFDEIWDIIFFYWNRIALCCCVSLCCTTLWIGHMYTYVTSLSMLPLNPPPFPPPLGHCRAPSWVPCVMQ